MLKAVVRVNNRVTLFLGITRDNTDRLHVDEPIAIDLQVLVQQSGGRPVQDIVLYAGETDRDVYDQLASRGLPLPPFVEPQP
jgi:hypothetical protein